MKKSKGIAKSQDDNLRQPLSARGLGSLQNAGLSAVNPMSHSLPSLHSAATAVGGGGDEFSSIGEIRLAEMLQPAIRKARNTFSKPILGDLFSQHLDSKKALEGLLYRSRVEAKNNASSHRVGSSNNRDDFASKDDTGDTVVSPTSSDMHEDISEVDEGNIGVLNLRQQLAITIRNWSYIEDNDANLINEGAVHAIISLASMEDNFIKSCCAAALYQLSSRAKNRESLLSLGATAGVITFVVNLKNFKIGQQAAMTLCNLSMQRGFEGIMARDGTILALVILMGIKGQRLLPICIQTFYNLTCVDNYFKGCERVVKAVLNLPPPPAGSGFDYMHYIVKILVNCSRYSWMRLRIIEDGAIALIMSIIPSLPNRDKDNQAELVDNILTTIRLLTDSQGCRQEMISKGIFDILNSIYSYCITVTNKQFLIKSIHNLITGSVLSIPNFEMAVTLTARLVLEPGTGGSDMVTLQYCCACLQNFSAVQMRGSSKLATKVVDCLPILLEISDVTSRFYSISTAGNIFFTNLCQDRTKIENVLRTFIKAGDKLEDVDSVRELSLSFAKLSVETSYMLLLEKLDLLPHILALLLRIVRAHNQDAAIEESCCVAICRISLSIKDVNEDTRKDLADVLVSMLSRDSLYLLENAISCIYALGEVGLCLKEMLSASLINNIAQIVIKYSEHINICRTCCAALVVFSQTGNAHQLLSSDNVLNMLLTTTKSKDASTREFVAMTLCNLSTDLEARNKMIKKGVVELVAILAASTSESLLLICAKCICNLTLATDLHAQLCKQNIMQIIMMISLVRCVVIETKLRCARSAYNLISTSNLPAFRSSGACRVFAVLSAVDDKETQLVCARGYLLMTSTPEMREELIQHSMVLQALFAMVKNSSPKTKGIVGLAVCNLLACPNAQMPTIAAGGLSVLKVFVTMNKKDSLKEAVSKVLINLASTPEVHNYLLKEPIVQILNLIIQRGKGSMLNSALSALACFGQYKLFRNAMITNACALELVNSILQGGISDSTSALEAVRCICYMSYESDRARTLVVNGHVILALHVVYGDPKLVSPEVVRMMAIIIRNISFDPSISSLILRQDAFGLLLNIIRQHPDLKAYTLKCAVTVVHNLSRDEDLHVQLIDNHIVAILKEVITDSDCHTCASTSTSFNPNSQFKSFAALIALPGPKMMMTEDDAFYICRAMNNLSRTQGCHEGMANGGLLEVFSLLYPSLTETSKFEVSAALSRVASSKSCRPPLVAAGVSTILLNLSMSTYLPTQQQCNLAMSYLSDITKVDKGNVASTLLLCLSIDEKTSEPSKEVVVVDTSASNVRPEDVPKDKSLRAMVNEGLAGKKSELKLVEMPGNGQSEPLESNIPESIEKNKQYIELVKIEMEQLKGSFSLLKYTTFSDKKTLEWGGGAEEIHIKLPLPSIQSDRGQESGSSVDRTGDLAKVAMRKDPLDKDLTDWSAQLVEVITVVEEPASTGIGSTPKKASRAAFENEESDEKAAIKYGGLSKYKNGLPGKAWKKNSQSAGSHNITTTTTTTSTASATFDGRSGSFRRPLSHENSFSDDLSVSSDLTFTS